MADAAPTSSYKALPFQTAPKEEAVDIGNERTGILTFPKYNDLTVVESAWMAANGTKKTAFQYTSKIALKIARAEQAKPIDTHAFVAKTLAAAMGAEMQFTPLELDWQVQYVAELEHVAFEVLDLAVTQQQMLVTCVIRHRLPNMGEWTSRDTANMPSELCEHIYKFALVEQARGKSEDPTADSIVEVEEMLGKSRTAPTKAPRKSAGRKSSTRAKTSSQVTPTSPSNASEASPPDTSSNASPKEAS